MPLLTAIILALTVNVIEQSLAPPKPSPPTLTTIPTPPTQPKPPPPPPPPPAPSGPRAVALQQQVTAAVATKATTVVLAGGEYNFNGADFEIYNAFHLRFEATAPVKLWFAAGFGVHFRGSSNVSVGGGWTIDYDPPWTKRTAGLTYQLTNCSDILTEDLTVSCGT